MLRRSFLSVLAATPLTKAFGQTKEKACVGSPPSVQGTRKVGDNTIYGFFRDLDYEGQPSAARFVIISNTHIDNGRPFAVSIAAEGFSAGWVYFNVRTIGEGYDQRIGGIDFEFNRYNDDVGGNKFCKPGPPIDQIDKARNEGIKVLNFLYKLPGNPNHLPPPPEMPMPVATQSATRPVDHHSPSNRPVALSEDARRLLDGKRDGYDGSNRPLVPDPDEIPSPPIITPGTPSPTTLAPKP